MGAVSPVHSCLGQNTWSRLTQAILSYAEQPRVNSPTGWHSYLGLLMYFCGELDQDSNRATACRLEIHIFTAFSQTSIELCYLMTCLLEVGRGRPKIMAPAQPLCNHLRPFMNIMPPQAWLSLRQAHKQHLAWGLAWSCRGTDSTSWICEEVVTKRRVTVNHFNNWVFTVLLTCTDSPTRELEKVMCIGAVPAVTSAASRSKVSSSAGERPEH